MIFRCVLASLYEALSVRRLVGNAFGEWKNKKNCKKIKKNGKVARGCIVDPRSLVYLLKRFWSQTKIQTQKYQMHLWSCKCICDLVNAFAILQKHLQSCNLASAFSIFQMHLQSSKWICNLANAFKILQIHLRSCKWIFDHANEFTIL